MIQLDRDARTPVGEQLVEQLRFHLATGRFRPGDALPSTRELARELGISFHTVRKAYQALEAEGLLEGRPGAGYTVAARAPVPVADRLERAAAIAQEAVQRLVGLGLSEDEIEGVLQEQLAYLDRGEGRPTVLFAAPYRELAEAGAEQVSAALQDRAEAVTLDALAARVEADVVVAPLPVLRQAAQALPRAEAVGVIVHFAPEALAAVARMLPHETLGLVTRHADAVAPLLETLRREAGFTGSAVALAADAERERLAELARRADLLVYTPQARRRLRALLGEVRSVQLTPLVERRSLEAVVAAVRR